MIADVEAASLAIVILCAAAGEGPSNMKETLPGSVILAHDDEVIFLTVAKIVSRVGKRSFQFYGGSLGPFGAVAIALPLPSTFHFHPTSSIAHPWIHIHASACMGVAPAEPQGQRRCGFDLDGSRKQVVEAHLTYPMQVMRNLAKS